MAEPVATAGVAGPSPAVQVTGLTKAFGHRAVLRELHLLVPAGQRLVLVGPNGAGKTTLLRILAGLTRPSRGLVRVAGNDVARDADAVRRSIGFLSHQPLLYEDLTAEENLRFYGAMYGLRQPEGRIAALLGQVGLTARRGDLVRVYSRGMRQRLAIARALLHDPAVLLLDEPYTGPDAQATEMLDGLLRRAGASRAGGTPRTVLLTTHNLEQALALGDCLAILHRGRIVQRMEGEQRDTASFRAAYHAAMAAEG